MPSIKMKDRLRQIPFYLVTITINDDPAMLIRDHNPDLKLNGFTVTLAELTLMYQVWDGEKQWLSLRRILVNVKSEDWSFVLLINHVMMYTNKCNVCHD